MVADDGALLGGVGAPVAVCWGQGAQVLHRKQHQSFQTRALEGPPSTLPGRQLIRADALALRQGERPSMK